MNKFNFDEKLKKYKAFQRETLVLLANQAQNYFLDSWQKQGFDGKEWQEVQRRIPGTNAYKYPKKKGVGRRTQKILIGAGYSKRGGTLRRAVSTMARTSQIMEDSVRMVIDLPYAKIHNEGGKAGRGLKANIPKRQFVGQTKELTAKQELIINKQFKRLWEA